MPRFTVRAEDNGWWKMIVRGFVVGDRQGELLEVSQVAAVARGIPGLLNDSYKTVSAGSDYAECGQSKELPAR